MYQRNEERLIIALYASINLSSSEQKDSHAWKKARTHLFGPFARGSRIFRGIFVSLYLRENFATLIKDTKVDRPGKIPSCFLLCDTLPFSAMCLRSHDKSWNESKNESSRPLVLSWKRSPPSRDRALSSPWERDAGLSSETQSASGRPRTVFILIGERVKYTREAIRRSRDYVARECRRWRNEKPRSSHFSIIPKRGRLDRR
jgi:hypothetical protein